MRLTPVLASCRSESSFVRIGDDVQKSDRARDIAVVPIHTCCCGLAFVGVCKDYGAREVPDLLILHSVDFRTF